MDLNLIYPNEWRVNAQKGESCFSPFLCGQKTYDEKRKTYVLNVSSYARFFDPQTGKIYRIFKPTVLRFPKNERKLPKKAGYVLQTKPNAQCGADDSLTPVCSDIVFHFPRSKLLEIKYDNDSCPIIRFFKKHNDRIRKINPSFPSCPEIDTLIKKYNIATVSKKLIDMS